MILTGRLLNTFLSTITIAKSIESYWDGSALPYRIILILITVLLLTLYILTEAHYYI